METVKNYLVTKAPPALLIYFNVFESRTEKGHEDMLAWHKTNRRTSGHVWLLQDMCEDKFEDMRTLMRTAGHVRLFWSDWRRKAETHHKCCETSWDTFRTVLLYHVSVQWGTTFRLWAPQVFRFLFDLKTFWPQLNPAACLPVLLDNKTRRLHRPPSWRQDPDPRFWTLETVRKKHPHPHPHPTHLLVCSFVPAEQIICRWCLCLLSCV